MTKIDIDFNDVPTEILPIPGGVYTMDIIGTPTLEDVQSKPGNKKIVVILAVVEGPEGDLTYQNRRVFDNISTQLPTRIKRLALSAGLEVGADGINLDDLTGRRVEVKLKENTYQDQMTKEMKTNTKVADYIIPTE